MQDRLMGLSLKDKNKNFWIREQTKVNDIIKRVSSLKYKLAGHIAR